MSKKQNVSSKILTDEELEKLIEEAIVDCCDESECLSGFAVMIEDNLEFPFVAKVIGEEVIVTGVTEEKDRILAECERKGKKYNIDILDLEFTSPVKGSEWIDAYKKWK
jgi:hypothetical protein